MDDGCLDDKTEVLIASRMEMLDGCNAEKFEFNGRKALDHYHSTIKDQLSEDDFGLYIAIDAHTGDWLIGESDEVVFEMSDRNLCAHPVVIQHPNIGTMRLSSRQTRSFK